MFLRKKKKKIILLEEREELNYLKRKVKKDKEIKNL